MVDWGGGEAPAPRSEEGGWTAPVAAAGTVGRLLPLYRGRLTSASGTLELAEGFMVMCDLYLSAAVSAKRRYRCLPR